MRRVAAAITVADKVWIATALLLYLAGAFFPVLAATPHRSLWIVNERHHQRGIKDASCVPGGAALNTSTFSQLSVFDDRQVTFEVASHTSCPDAPADPQWGWRWEVPEIKKKIFRYKLPAEDFDKLKTFLEAAEVKGLNDFMNAGPGVGDFRVTVNRPAETQTITVLSLMPKHYSLRKDPTLLRVICTAKSLTRRVVGSGEVSAWCDMLPTAF
jgi:hypothetical protein